MSLRAVVAAGVFLLLTGCAPALQDGEKGRPTVVASFYPLYEAAERVAGDQATVVNLTPPGVEPHDVELSAAQLDQVIDADLVVYLGGGFQPAVERALRRATGAVVDVTEGLPARAAVGGEHGDDEHGHDDDELDPHVWLDPSLMTRIVDRIEQALMQLVPSTQGLRERAGTYRAYIEALDRDLASGLEDCARRVLVTSHAAFGYLAARYNLRQEPISGLSPSSEPDPRRLAELTDLVRREGVTTVFTETLVSPRVAETLAREAGVDTAVLDPVESIAESDLAAGRDYVSVMRSNLSALREALDCS